MRAYIRGYLEKKYNILEAGDGRDGFKKATETIPDLIISDVMMTEMDGFEFCGKLKADERTNHIPVVLLTARAEPEDKIEGLEAGADDYLLKPFDAKELTTRIKNLIIQRQKLREQIYKEIILNSNDISAASADNKFLFRLIDICNKHISDSDLNAEMLGQKVGLSRSQLHRKLKAIINQSATEFIKTLRLRRAALLISQNQNNISQIAYEVGFSNLSYFAKSFKEVYSLTPSEYPKHKSHNNQHIAD
jgi:DNA-binding response OmpR family regulator